MNPSKINFPPYNLFIDNYQYILKGRYANGDCSYRCPQRNIYKVMIRDSHDKIKKTLDKNDKIEFTIVSTQNSHSCNNEHNLIKEGKLNTLDNNENLAAALIKKNLTKPLSFHEDIMYKATIPLKKRQIKRILQKLRNENLPCDKDCLNDPSLITITIEENIQELSNLSFFFCEEKIINFHMNNKLENFIIFSTPFHIKLFSEAQQILIDGTFKSCPRNYYQILNIINIYKK